VTIAPFTDAQLEFLRAHRQAVLATGRRDGSPQVSTVVYAVDGEDDPDALVPTLDEQQRTVIRVTADRVLFNP
jgi:hypothetical protein